MEIGTRTCSFLRKMVEGYRNLCPGHDPVPEEAAIVPRKVW